MQTDVFNPLFILERRFALGIFKENSREYNVQFFRGYEYPEGKRLVREFSLAIPKSYVYGVGEDLFKTFVLEMFQEVTKPSCKSTGDAVGKLKKLFRKVKARLMLYIGYLDEQYCKPANRKFNKSKALEWFTAELLKIGDMLWVQRRTAAQ